jgi:hypothetical protein
MGLSLEANRGLDGFKLLAPRSPGQDIHGIRQHSEFLRIRQFLH